MKFVDKKNCVTCRLEVWRRKALVDHIDLGVIVAHTMHQCYLIITITNIILTGSFDKNIPQSFKAFHTLSESFFLFGVFEDRKPDFEFVKWLDTNLQIESLQSLPL